VLMKLRISGSEMPVAGSLREMDADGARGVP
jgi:hypothetical protein